MQCSQRSCAVVHVLYAPEISQGKVQVPKVLYVPLLCLIRYLVVLAWELRYEGVDRMPCISGRAAYLGRSQAELPVGKVR